MPAVAIGLLMAVLGSQIFATLIRARERAYASGRLGVARLPAPVISIGNLRVGGSGKTPAVIALGQQLQARGGIAFDVLTRGYRRSSSHLAIARRGDEDSTEVGDEPRLIAQKLQVPVLVHPDRFRAGLEAERRFHTQLHLLDDGFQHWQLARDVDIVLVTAADLHDRLLPAGRLRETPAALARAHAVIWVGAETGFDPERELATARAQLQPWTSAPVFVAHKRALPLTETPRRAYAFCGLARPDSFWQTLDQLGVEVVGREAFRDHFRYSFADLRRLRGHAHALGAESFITTAKDAMNFPVRQHRPLEPMIGPLYVVQIELEISAIADLLALALAIIERNRPPEAAA